MARWGSTDGWTKNEKYKSIPEIMLRNRSLAFLTRYQYPDILAGLPTAEELQDIQAATSAVPAERTGALAAIEAEVSDAKALESGDKDPLLEAMEDDFDREAEPVPAEEGASDGNVTA